MPMKVSFASSKLEKRCTEAKEMAKAFDQKVCKSLQRRMAELKSANRVQDVLDGTGKWHWLKGDEVIAASLSANWRIIVRPSEKDNDCAIVEVESIEDYH